MSEFGDDAISILAGVESLTSTRWQDLPEADLPAAAAALARAKAVIEGALVAVAHELEITDAAAAHGWASAKDFLTAQLGGYQGAGAGYVRLAEQTRLLPRLREAMTSGRSRSTPPIWSASTTTSSPRSTPTTACTPTIATSPPANAAPTSHASCRSPRTVSAA